MAKDDYHVIIYQILAYLYQQLKRGQKVDIEKLSNNGGLFEINKNYYMFIMSSLVKTDLISGVIIVNSLSQQYIDGLENIQITVKGIEYLLDNAFLKKAHKFLKDIKEITPFI